MTHAYEFWEEISGFLWYHGHWHLYYDWGKGVLQLLQSTDSNRLPQGWLMSEQGWLYLEKGDYISVNKLFTDAKRLFYAEENQKGICIIERYMGVLAYRQNDLDNALRQYQIAEQIAKINNYELSLLEIYNLQASYDCSTLSEATNLLRPELPWRVTQCIMANWQALPAGLFQIIIGKMLCDLAF